MSDDLRSLRARLVVARDTGRHDDALAVVRAILAIAPDDGPTLAVLASLTNASRSLQGSGVIATNVQTRAASLPATERPKRPPTIQIPPRRAQTAPPVISAAPVPAPLPVAEETVRARPNATISAPPPLRPPHVVDLDFDAGDDEAVIVDEASASPEDDVDAANTLRGMLAVPASTRAARPSFPPDEVTAPRELATGAAIRMPRDPIDSPFFSPLPRERRGPVLARFARRTVAPGTIVIRQGETMHPLFVVVRGHLEVRSERADGVMVTLDHARDGEFVGELALLSHTPSAFQVIAATPGELLALAPKDFFDVAGAFPALWTFLKDASERRSRDYDQRMRR